MTTPAKSSAPKTAKAKHIQWQVLEVKLHAWGQLEEYGNMGWEPFQIEKGGGFFFAYLKRQK